MTTSTPDTFFVMAFLTKPGEPTDLATPHVTFLARASTAQAVDMVQLRQTIQQKISHIPQFSLSVTGVKSFGFNEEFTVNTLECVEKNDSKLHCILLNMFTEAGYEFTYPQFTGENFQAHMTVHDGNPQLNGTIISITHLVISRHVGGFGSGNIQHSEPILL
jgi:hypothetical protein